LCAYFDASKAQGAASLSGPAVDMASQNAAQASTY
jgi:hypothetical protein